MYTCLILLLLTSVFKIIHHINALGDVWNDTTHKSQNAPINNFTNGAKDTNWKYRGLWFDVHGNKVLLQVMDKLWLFSALVLPMVQSGYITFKSLDTHLIILNIRDNREANSADSMNEKNMEDEELKSFTESNTTM